MRRVSNKKYFKTKSEYWKSRQIKEKALAINLLNANTKVQKSASDSVLTAGLELVPVWQGSCAWATTCTKTCIYLAGVGNIIKKNSGFLSAPLMCKLARHWLYINIHELFQDRLERELDIHLRKSELSKADAWVRLDVFSEYKLRDEYAPRHKDITFYDYFKESDRIMQETPDNIKEIYSWNEKSGLKELEQCIHMGKPTAVVYPRKVHKELFSCFDKDDEGKVLEHNGVLIVDADESDLHAINYSRQGQLVVGALSEKVTAQGMKETKFLQSWQHANELIGL